MQNKKITAQDIADKLNISRNTVSKALIILEIYLKILR